MLNIFCKKYNVLGRMFLIGVQVCCPYKLLMNTFSHLVYRYSFYQNIYSSNPALSNQERIRKSRLSDASETDDMTAFKKVPPMKRVLRSLQNYGGAWKSYFKHEIMLAGMCLAFLYMTVLGLDAITIGKLKHAYSLRRRHRISSTQIF